MDTREGCTRGRYGTDSALDAQLFQPTTYDTGNGAMERDDRQVRQEARQLLGKMSSGDPGRAYRNYPIASFPKTAYRAASFVRLIVTADQYEQLNDLLSQLWELNEEFAGELIAEATVYLTLTGEHAALEEAFVKWCDSYCRARLKKPNSKDRGDLFTKFVRLFLEYDNAVGMESRPKSLDYVCLHRCRLYVAWLLFENTWSGLFGSVQDGTGLRIQVPDQWTPGACELFVTVFGFGQNGLSEFLEMASPLVLAEKSKDRDHLSRQALLDEIAVLMDDLWRMRPFLARNFHPEKTLIQLGEALYIACDWAANVGVMTLYVGRTEREVLGNLPTGRSIATVVVGRDGILADGYRPWITAGDPDHEEHVRRLATNAHVLELIHERLFSFYDQIDFGRIREQVKKEAVSGDIDDEALALSLQDLGSEDKTTEGDQARRSPVAGPIRPLRLDRLLNVLERKLGCEVQRGKGDETTVFRSGGKKYRLGQRKEVHAVLLKRVLKRLEIPRTEWWQAVYG